MVLLDSLMVAKVRYTGYMEDPHITTYDITQQITRSKKINQLDLME